MSAEPPPEAAAGRAGPASAAERPASPWRVRALFLASIVYVLFTSLHGELYPGLQAPPFANPGLPLGAAREWDAAEIRVTFRDGSEQRLALQALLERAHFKMRPRIEAALWRERDASGAPVARAWVVAEVARRFAARDPVRVEAWRLPRGDEPAAWIFAAPIPEPAP